MAPAESMLIGSLILFIIPYLLIPAIAIVAGLLIFFLGRRAVRRKYGENEKT